MKVTQLMTTVLITLDLDDRLDKAKEIFAQTHFHHLLILDGTQLRGLITDRDLFENLSPTLGTPNESHKDLSLVNQPVHKIMKRDLVVIKEHDTIAHAVDLFYEKNITCLPVVNDEFEAIGIITWRDVMKVLAKRSQQKRHKNKKKHSR